MRRKRIIWAILCALGSAMIGFFANHLTEAYGCIPFCLGVGLMVFSITELTK